MPCVRSAAVLPSLPLARGRNYFAHTPDLRDLQGLSVEARAVSPDYFATLVVPVLSGRAIADGDRQDGAPAAVVNESFAHEFWPDTDPIGRRVVIDKATREVVGLV